VGPASIPGPPPFRPPRVPATGAGRERARARLARRNESAASKAVRRRPGAHASSAIRLGRYLDTERERRSRSPSRRAPPSRPAAIERRGEGTVVRPIAPSIGRENARARLARRRRLPGRDDSSGGTWRPNAGRPQSSSARENTGGLGRATGAVLAPSARARISTIGECPPGAEPVSGSADRCGAR